MAESLLARGPEDGLNSLEPDCEVIICACDDVLSTHLRSGESVEGGLIQKRGQPVHAVADRRVQPCQTARAGSSSSGGWSLLVNFWRVPEHGQVSWSWSLEIERNTHQWRELERHLIDRGQRRRVSALHTGRDAKMEIDVLWTLDRAEVDLLDRRPNRTFDHFIGQGARNQRVVAICLARCPIGVLADQSRCDFRVIRVRETRIPCSPRSAPPDAKTIA
jgi:hypothetical protein